MSTNHGGAQTTMNIQHDPFALPLPPDPEHGYRVPRVPRWLRELTAKLGMPEVAHIGDMQRWLWNDGGTGVIIDRLTHTWQVVAFGQRRSITMRSSAEPTDKQIRDCVNLADLAYDTAHAPADIEASA